jgi:hypothetical protein
MLSTDKEGMTTRNIVRAEDLNKVKDETRSSIRLSERVLTKPPQSLARGPGKDFRQDNVPNSLFVPVHRESGSYNPFSEIEILRHHFCGLESSFMRVLDEFMPL